MRNIFRISGVILLIPSIFLFYSCIKKPTPPVISTTSVTAISYTTATSGGEVTDDGGATVTAKGVCWNTSLDPTVSNSKTSDGTGTGSFSSSFTGLIAGTTYYVRAYATNTAGTGYGNQVTFSTGQISLATLTTTATTSITPTTAVSGGNITTDNGGSVTARGVCWGTVTNPTTANNKTTDGTGTGSFVSNLISLQPGTIYYVRSYATNSAGTSYGNEISFTTNQVKAQWNKSYFGQNAWAWNVSVVNDNVVWVMDSNADSISITTNGGVSWTSKPLPIPAGYTRAAGGICALSNSKAYYILSISDIKGIYLTNDGGNTWNKQSTGFNQNSLFPDIIHFWNENVGVAIGDASPNFEIYTTTNGGVQWNRVPDGNMPNGNNEVTWNTQAVFNVVGNSIFFLTSTARIFKSLDKGITWSAINTPFYNTTFADSSLTFDFKDNNNGLVSYYSRNGLSNKIYKTTNGGLNWSSITTNNFYHIIKYITTANSYFSMNKYGGLSYSSNDGQTWTNVTYFNNIRLMTASYSSTGKIYFGGSNGYIYYSDYFTQIEK